MAFTMRVYPVARHELGLFRLKIQEGRWGLIHICRRK